MSYYQCVENNRYRAVAYEDFIKITNPRAIFMVDSITLVHPENLTLTLAHCRNFINFVENTKKLEKIYQH